jgi:hypothetical protein
VYPNGPSIVYDWNTNRDVRRAFAPSRVGLSMYEQDAAGLGGAVGYLRPSTPVVHTPDEARS